MAKINETMIEKIITLVGGAGNIITAGNCMTRLRLTLKDGSLVNNAELKKTENVMGVIESDGQLQIILGPGKAQTAAELMNKSLQSGAHKNVSPSSDEKDLNQIASEQKKVMKAKQTSGFHRFLSKFAAIFTPLIPGLIAAGLLLGISTLISAICSNIGVKPEGTLRYLIEYLSVFSKGLFAFLGILIGYNAQKEFGGSGINGAILATFFILGFDPNIRTVLLNSGYTFEMLAMPGTGLYNTGMTEFFGIKIVPQGNIIGILIASISGAYVERFVRRFIPDSLDMLLTSTITLLIMGALIFTVIMPVAGILFQGVSWLFLTLNGNPLGCAILAGLFLIAVVFGVHQGFIPVYFALVESQGFNSLFPILAMAGAGQVGAAIALYIKAKQGSVLRNQIRGAIFPGFMGIGEPLIYGVTLPRMRPFVTACLGGAVGGLFLGFIAYFGLPIGLNSAFGPSGLVAIPLMTSNNGIFPAMGVYLAGLLISYIAGFILTYLFGTKNVDLD